MRRQYSKLQQNDGSSNHDIQLNLRIHKQLLDQKPKEIKITNDSKLQINQTTDKFKQMKSIYLAGTSSLKNNDKLKFNKVQKVQIKANADQLIKVLQNGRERRNLRRKKNDDLDQKMEDSIQGRKYQTNVHQREGSRSQMMIKANQSTNGRRTFELPQSQLKIKKVLKEMKEQENRINKLKQETQWKQIQSLLASKSEIQSPLVQKDRNKRRHQLEAAKQLLTGKVSIIWIFVIGGIIQEDDRLRITKMYSGLSETPYLVPLCKRAEQIKTFLQVPNSLFKIVADLSNIGQALNCRNNTKVVQFYIYNDVGEKGIAKALSHKSESRKVKGIYNYLSKIIDRAQQQIQNEIQLFQTKNGINKKKGFKKFPSFIKLSGQDKTYATLYRANLYGAKNVLKQQLKLHYQEFMNLVKQRYGNIQHQKKNIQDYQKLNHFLKQFSIAIARQVVKFYVRQSFYYQILNSMLRTMKTTQQFKPCIFPFYQNYLAIKKFYTLDLQQNARKIKAQTLYRGARMRSRDFNSLKPGVFIQMLGFMSTSKNLNRAKQFCDRDGYIFVISVPELTIPERFNKYDHGFVDINKYNLASKEFVLEQQVLFNALNVFKVTKIQKQAARHLIYLQYGPIFQLLNKQKSKMTSDQRDVLTNYQYCANMLDQIQDQGDVYLLANQYDQSKIYYKDKLKQNGKQGKYYYKLANVQQQCGQLDQANKNVQISLKLQLQNLDINDRQKCLKVFSIHSKNADISFYLEDYLTAEVAITNAIQLLDDNNQFQKAKKIRQRGQIKFKKGQIIEAQKDFELSEQIFKNLKNKAEEKRKSVNRSYYFSFLSLICSSTTHQQIDRQRQQKLKQIQNIQRQIRDMQESINEQLIKVNNSLKQVAHYAEDKQKYQVCVKKARAYLLGVKQRQTNDPMQKARLKALEATMQDYLQLAQSEKLLYQAIRLVQSNQPFNPHVGKYSEILGNLQKKQLQKFSNPKILLLTPLTKGMQPIIFDRQQQNKIYQKCRKNFQKAINVLLYNHKTKNSPQVISLKNQLGQLDFYQSKFQSSQQIIKQVKQSCSNIQNAHSQISKSSLLLSKIGYARGQLRNSFQNVQQSYNNLRAVIVKKQQTKYISIFQSNSLLLQIKLHRSKIYLKQLNHDLSLRDLQQMKTIIQKKIDQKDNHTLLADIYQVSAENQIAKYGTFSNQFQSALYLRQKQIGQYNLANAVTYCNYAKYLLLTDQLSTAEKMLHKAVEIFSCFSEEHPITWIALYCAGLLQQKRQHNQQAIRYIKASLLKAKQKCDKDHITLNKIRLQYAKALLRAGKIEQAIKQFQNLQQDLQNQINASQARKAIVSQLDDEKITVKKFLYQSLKQSYKQLNKNDATNLNLSSIGIQRCDKKMNQLKSSFKMEIKQKQQ